MTARVQDASAKELESSQEFVVEKLRWTKQTKDCLPAFLQLDRKLGGAFSRYVVATYRLGEAEGKDSQSGGSPGRPLWQLGRLSDTAPEWVAWKEALAYLDIRTGAPRTEAPLCLWETALRDLGRAQAVPTMDRQVMSQREQSHRQKWLSSVQMAELSQDVPRVEVDF